MNISSKNNLCSFIGGKSTKNISYQTFLSVYKNDVEPSKFYFYYTLVGLMKNKTQKFVEISTLWSVKNDFCTINIFLK